MAEDNWVYQDPFGRRVGGTEFQATLDQVWGIPGITNEDVNFWQSLMFGNPGQAAAIYADAMTTTMAKQGYQRMTDQWDHQEVMRGRYGRQLENFKRNQLGAFDKEIARLSGFMEDPSTIRSDPLLASRLTDVEANIGKQLQTVEKGAAGQMADAGLRASGKVENPLVGAGIKAQEAKGRNMAQLLSEIESEHQRLSGPGGARAQFEGAMMDQQRAIDQGGFLDLGALQQMYAGSMTPNINVDASAYDILGLSESKRQFDVGTLANVLLGLASASTQMGSGMMSMIGKK